MRTFRRVVSKETSCFCKLLKDVFLQDVNEDWEREEENMDSCLFLTTGGLRKWFPNVFRQLHVSSR